MKAAFPRCTQVLVALVAGASTVAVAQVATGPAPRAVAFPPALSVMVGVSTYGARARRDSGASEFTYPLSTGPTVSARLQSPLGRRFGLHVGGGFSYRNPREDVGGSPRRSSNERVATMRGEGGLLFRFKPAAPIYFGGGFVYYRHGGDPVFGQGRGAMTETGGAFGIGYDFGRKPGSNVAGRIDYWTYFVSPNASGPTSGVEAKSSARDWTFTVGATYRLRLPERRGS